MPGTTLAILVVLGVLAWSLGTGPRPPRFLPDDGPLGLGAGVGVTCPVCTGTRVVADRGRRRTPTVTCGDCRTVFAVRALAPAGRTTTFVD